MKKLFLLALLSIGLLNCQAQFQPNNLYGTIFKRGAFDSTLFFPTGCGAPSGNTSLRSVALKLAAKYYDSCAGKEYTYNPKTQAWKETGVTTTSLPWDSVTGKPVNFGTTYALSNDVKDSILARVTLSTAQTITGQKSFTKAIKVDLTDTNEGVVVNNQNGVQVSLRNGNVFANTNGINAPLITFAPSNKVHLDPQGYGSLAHNIQSSGYLFASQYVSGSNFLGAPTTQSINTPFGIASYVRPDVVGALDPLAGIFGVFDTASWVNGAALSFQTSRGNDISGGGLRSEKMRLFSNGVLRLNTLAGTGDRMVVAGADGSLTTQPMPSGTGFIQNQFTAPQASDIWIDGRFRSGSVRVVRSEQDSAVAVFSNNTFDPWASNFSGFRFVNAGMGTSFRTQLEGWNNGVRSLSIIPGSPNVGNALASINSWGFFSAFPQSASNVWVQGFPSGWRLFSDSSNRLSWLQAGPFSASFEISGLTANRIFTLPDTSGRFALTNDATNFIRNQTASAQTGGLFVNGVIRTSNTTATSSNSTGALIVDGGVGIGGGLNMLGVLNVNGSNNGFVYNDNSFLPGIGIRNTNTGNQALSGISLGAGPTAGIDYINNNYITTALRNNGVFNTKGEAGIVIAANLTSANSNAQRIRLSNIGSTKTNISIEPNNNVLFNTATDNGAGIAQFNGSVVPTSNNSFSNGTSSFQWSDLRSVLGTFTGTLNLNASSGLSYAATNGSSTFSMNPLGYSFNRNVATGTIYNSGAHAYQWQKTNSATASGDFLRLQVYTPAGVQVTDQAISVNGAGNITFFNNIQAGGAGVFNGGQVSVNSPSATTASAVVISANAGATAGFNRPQVQLRTADGNAWLVRSAGDGGNVFQLSYNDAMTGLTLTTTGRTLFNTGTDNGSGSVGQFNGSVTPTTNNTFSLGTTSFRWSSVNSSTLTANAFGQSATFGASGNAGDNWIRIQGQTTSWDLGARQTSSGNVFGIAEGGVAYRVTVAPTTGVVNILSTTASTSTTTGALIVGGGIGANGTITAPGFTSTGTATLSGLSGTGNRIVIANGSNALVSAVIGSGLAFDGTTLTATGGSSGSITGSGTSGTVALFSGSSSISNSIITQASTTVTVAGTLAATTINGAGTGLTGTASGLSIGGNAATVTNGVYTSSTYADPTWITSLAWSKITGAPAFITGNQTITLSGPVTGSGTTAITTTIGAGAVTNSMLAGSIDYSKMNAATVPTWNQNTTGNAATATNVAWTGVTGRPTALSQFTNDVPFATTSQLGSYLPLSGGTLTGVLNGTSAGFSSTTPSSSPTSGALVVAGGVGVGGALNVSGAAFLGQTFTNSQFVSTSATNSGTALSGYRISSTPSQSTSRQWLITSDLATYGDFQIMQSTTATGSTFQYALYFDANRAATFSSSVTAPNFVVNETDQAFALRTNSGWGGWARFLASIQNSSGTALGGIGGYGTAGTSLTYLWAGNTYENRTIEIDAGGSKEVRTFGILRVNSDQLLVDGGSGSGRLTFATTGATNTIFSTTTSFGSYNGLRLQAAGWSLHNGTGVVVDITGAGGATFSNPISVSSNNQATSRITISNTAAGSNYSWVAGNVNIGQTGLDLWDGASTILRFAPNGSASFIGSITSNGNGLFDAVYSDISTGENRGFKLTNTGATNGTWHVTSGRTGISNDEFVIRNGVTDINALFISPSGAANFSSSLTAKTLIGNTQSFTSAGTIAEDVTTVFCSNSSGSVYSLTMPSATTPGKFLLVVKTGGGLNNNVNISTNGGTLSLFCLSSALLVSNGTNWSVVSYYDGASVCF